MEDQYIIKLDQIEIETHSHNPPKIKMLGTPTLYFNDDDTYLQTDQLIHDQETISRIVTESFESLVRLAISSWSCKYERYLLRIINTKNNEMIYHKILD